MWSVTELSDLYETTENQIGPPFGINNASQQRLKYIGYRHCPEIRAERSAQSHFGGVGIFQQVCDVCIQRAQ